MELKCRLTHNLLEIKVDETETTLFKNYPNEIDDMIAHLFDVIDDLARLKDETLKDVINKQIEKL